MKESLAASLVRIYATDGRVVGAGFLVGERDILTCAHVIAQALGLADDAPDKPSSTVSLDFPQLARHTLLSAKVVFWYPVQADGRGDIAVLKLLDEPPVGAEAVHFAPADQVWDHPFRALGFPSGYDDGVWATGRLLGRQGTNWIQLEDDKVPGFAVLADFSGAPVWDEQLQGVVGMIVASSQPAATNAAFAIPSNVLMEAWPQLASIMRPPAPPLLLSPRESLSPDQVQFTAFYPAMTAVEKWTTLLVYVSLVSALSDIQSDASRFRDELGAPPRTFRALSPFLLVRGTVLTVVPECHGITFNPPSISFQWFEEWHRAAFRFRANKNLAGLACNGEIYVYAGPLLIGTLKMSLLFNEQQLLSMGIASEKPAEVTGGIYQQMFVSYSHEDTAIVEICRNIYRALGLRVMIDIDTLRSGQVWSNALERMINTADVFQLFWSRHAAASRYVRQEWEYALALSKGEGFIRPVYWEKPLVPPPRELAMLHFAYLPPDTFRSLSSSAESSSRYPARWVSKIGLLLIGAVLGVLLGGFTKGLGGGIIGLLIGISIMALVVIWWKYHHNGKL